MRFTLTLIMLLITANGLLAWNAERWRFDSIVVHHSASRTGDYASIQAIHAKRGWNDAAYQLILSNGSMDLPAGMLEASSHYRDLSPGPATSNQISNLGGLHICIIGNYQTDSFPDSLRPPLGRALRELSKKYHIKPEQILFHRDVSPSVCPGKHIQKEEMLRWMRERADECPLEIAAQQDKTIAIAGLTLRNYPRFLLLIHVIISVTILLASLFCWKIKQRKTKSNRHTTSFPKKSSVDTARTRGPSSRGIRYPRT